MENSTKHHDFKPDPNLFEDNLQRFMQIRNEIQEEIGKISPNVEQLKRATQSLLSHVDVFKALAERAAEHIRPAITSAAREMASDSAEKFNRLIDEELKEKIRELDLSVQHAQRVLNETLDEKYRKVIRYSCIICVLCGFAGFGGGYFYSKPSTYVLSTKFMETYNLGLKAKRASLQERAPEKQRKKR